MARLMSGGDNEKRVASIEALLKHAGVRTLELTSPATFADYRQAMAAATERAEQELGECMLLSWYDRDRDFESPQHSSECHLDSAIPGYVDYGVSHGARLRITAEQDRFVFFFMPTSI